MFFLFRFDIVLRQNMHCNLLLHQMYRCMYLQNMCRNYKNCHNTRYVNLCIYQNYNHLLLFRLFHYVLYQTMSNNILCSLYHQFHQQMYIPNLNYYTRSNLGSMSLCNSLLLQNTSYQQYMLYMLDWFHSNNIRHYMIYNTHLDRCWCSPHCSDMPLDTQYNSQQSSLYNSSLLLSMCCSVLLLCHTNQHCCCHYVSHFHWNSQLVSDIQNTVFLLSSHYLYPKSIHCLLSDSCSVHRLHSMSILYIVIVLCGLLMCRRLNNIRCLQYFVHRQNNSNYYHHTQIAQYIDYCCCYIRLNNIHCLLCLRHRWNNTDYVQNIVIVLYTNYCCCYIRLCNNHWIHLNNLMRQHHYIQCVQNIHHNSFHLHCRLCCLVQLSLHHRHNNIPQ